MKIKDFFFNNILLLGFISIIFLMPSCVPHKQFLILQDSQSEHQLNPQAYRLNRGDVIQISISSIVDEQFNTLKTSSSNGGVGQTYTVGDSGNVVIPLFGTIKASEFTPMELQQELQSKIKDYINDGIITVSLLSFKISVLGEVARPGMQVVLSGKINLLDALANAGDITNTGRRDNVRLMRSQDNKMKTYFINIQKTSFIESDLFYLQSGDILYVEPAKNKGAQANLPTLTLATTLVNVLFALTNIILIFSR